MDQNLIRAINSGDLKEVERVANETNVLSIDQQTGRSPLHIAAIQGDPAIIEKIAILVGTQIKAYINLGDVNARTPLYFAATSPHAAAVNYLLLREALAAKAICNCCGMTALERAAEMGHITNVEALMASKGMKNVNRDKAIELAKRNGHVDVQLFLNGFRAVRVLEKLFVLCLLSR